MFWYVPFFPPPSKIHPGSLICKNSRLLSIFVLSASSLPVSVYSAYPLQSLFPTSSVPHRPSVRKLPTLRLRPTNLFFCFPSTASHMQVCTPPPTCVAGGTWLGCGWGCEGDRASSDGLESLDSSGRRRPGKRAFVNARIISQVLRCPSLFSAPPPPFPVQPYLSLYSPS